MDPGLVACIRAGSEIAISDYQDLRERKYAYVAHIHAWFEDWDFLITPTVSVAAFPAERLMPAHWPSHPVGLDVLGRVFLSVQHGLEPGGDRAVRVHRARACRWGCRSSAGGSMTSACCRPPPRSNGRCRGRRKGRELLRSGVQGATAPWRVQGRALALPSLPAVQTRRSSSQSSTTPIRRICVSAGPGW